MKKKTIVASIGEEDSTILCTSDPYLLLVGVRSEVKNQEDGESRFVGKNEEELTNKYNFVAKAAHFEENALISDKDIYSLELGFTKFLQH